MKTPPPPRDADHAFTTPVDIDPEPKAVKRTKSITGKALAGRSDSDDWVPPRIWPRA